MSDPFAAINHRLDAHRKLLTLIAKAVLQASTQHGAIDMSAITDAAAALAADTASLQTLATKIQGDATVAEGLASDNAAALAALQSAHTAISGAIATLTTVDASLAPVAAAAH
jgi:hypothetical protein